MPNMKFLWLNLSSFTGNIGCIYLSKGDTVKAMEYHEQHLSIAQELNNIPLQTKAFFNLASLHLHVQDYSRALKCYQVSLHLHVQDYSRALKCYQVSLHLHVQDYSHALKCYQVSLHLHVHDYSRALKCYQVSLYLHVQDYSRALKC